jgi:pyruvate dehydrogenase E2 component (dihydrolipoamide acetyltransferase)
MPDFLLPDLGEGLEEAEFVAWKVQIGDRVVVDQIVAEVETAKATVEIPIPFAGVVSALHAQPGSTVAVGAPLITVSSDDEESSGSVLIGYGTAKTPRRSRRTATSPPAQDTATVAVISPLVRKLAQDAGINLATIVGTGSGGLVRRVDVESAMAGAHGGQTRIPIRGTRKTAAERLSRSRREIPEATVWVDVDATELVAARALLNRRTPEQPISLTALFARLAMLGLRRHPELNGHIDQDEIVLYDHVHLGVASHTARGLIVPVLRDAQRLTARGLSKALAALGAAARTGHVAAADLTGGTFTINNYGVFGVDGSAAIINHPQVAILGLGRIIPRPWVVAGQPAVRQIAQLSLVFDHRACDGGKAGGFLRYVADCIESPLAAIEDL